MKWLLNEGFAFLLQLFMTIAVGVGILVLALTLVRIFFTAAAIF